MAALRNWKMGNFLNLVYDEEYSGNNIFVNNGEKYFGNDKFRHMDSIILKRIGLNNIKYHSIEKSNNFSKDENYYYFISSVIGLETELRDNVETSILPLSKNVIDCAIKYKNFNIIFFNYVEVDSKRCLYLIDSKIKWLGINPKQVWSICNNSKIYEYKKELNLTINVFKSEILKIDTIYDFKYYGKPVDFKIDKNGPFFLCLNGMPRPYRYGVLCSLMKNNILDDTNWSLLEKYPNPNNNYYSDILSKQDIKKIYKEIKYFKNISSKNSNYESNVPKPWNKVFVNETYTNSYVNIVNETLFSDDRVHITEKSYNPFYFYQYPLIVSSYQHLKFIKNSHNFDLFEDIINIEYDNEKDHIKRFSMIIEEIKRIYKNKKHFIESYHKNKERFISNQKIVFEMENNKNDFNFFTNLKNLKNE